MKKNTKTRRRTGILRVGGKVYPISQLGEVLQAQLEGTPLPEPKKEEL